ncbi:prepilin peptidase CpaA [Roseibium hamelinense]|uniref:Prepilin peptidase CpaA n=1 Tax=Roseibium hamelinense TaxID=150831 RepID=A0A562SJ04_9HYPH|nr:prepilin peptidase [Roseibium hamelinense]MTI43919.1 peptidase [Roseibium hamelinense]TWI80786.1 prepilin peptidase CpaA [Roseibium hamelinense]
MQTLVWYILPVLLIAAGVSDILTMKIPNAIPGAFVLLFVGVGLYCSVGLDMWASHTATGIGILAVGFAFFSFGWMGGGDAKLFAAIGLWFGFSEALMNALLATTLIGAGLTIALIGFRLLPVLPKFCQELPWLLRLHDKKSGIPYGVAISAGALMYYPVAEWSLLLE